MVTEEELKAMWYVICTWSVRNIYQLVRENPRQRVVFDAWCKKYGI